MAALAEQVVVSAVVRVEQVVVSADVLAALVVPQANGNIRCSWFSIVTVMA